MDVSFRTRGLKRCYERSRDAHREWGPDVGRKYVQRIDQLRSMPRFQDLRKLVSLRFHRLSGDREGEYALTLQGRWRLIVEPGESDDQVTVKEVTNHYGD